MKHFGQWMHRIGKCRKQNLMRKEKSGGQEYFLDSGEARRTDLGNCRLYRVELQARCSPRFSQN
ncbi:MAG: hypothetical protein ACTHKU_16895, partial [Verrucomicrobiota bacterium]